MARALNEINRLSRLDVAISLAPAPPAPDEVREAAERCRMRVEHAFDPDCPCDQNTNCYAGAIADMDALLSALDARGGAG